MDPEFWHSKWEKREIGFHQDTPNPFLMEYLNRLDLPDRGRIFLPLCGKTRDIAWLLSEGFRVCGVELVEKAVIELFEELGVEPKIEELEKVKRYSFSDIDVLCGNFFDMTPEVLGPVDAVFDRAALVALPPVMRQDYVPHLQGLSASARQLLITFDYDQSKNQGPPFAVSKDEVHKSYGAFYDVVMLTSFEVKGGLRGQCPAMEEVWLLTPKE